MLIPHQTLHHLFLPTSMFIPDFLGASKLDLLRSISIINIIFKKSIAEESNFGCPFSNTGPISTVFGAPVFGFNAVANDAS